jgi:hypothetical protein
MFETNKLFPPTITLRVVGIYIALKKCKEPNEMSSASCLEGGYSVPHHHRNITVVFALHIHVLLQDQKPPDVPTPAAITLRPISRKLADRWLVRLEAKTW